MRARQHHPATRQAGLSLVELLVALAIGVLISLGIVNLFLQSRVSAQQDEETARLQENGRWALRYLSRELAMAGFYGNNIDGSAIATSLTFTSDCGTDWAMDSGVNLEHLDNASDAAATATFDCMVTGEIVPGTDVLAFRRVKDSPAMLDGTAIVPVENNKVYLRLQSLGGSGQLLKGGDLSLADKAAGSGVDTWEYLPKLVFVRSYSQSPGDGISSLCVKRLSTDSSTVSVESTECLVEGVENLQVEFGLDEDIPPDYAADYYTATPTAAQLESAISARIYILSRSVNEVQGYLNDKSYQLGQTSVAANNDGYYRRILHSTVMLRNSSLYEF
ncbi:MAG: PilW family protein [Halieaceae bacterium]